MKPMKVASLVALLLANSAGAQSFSDDFNRGDGPVGNGWVTWGAGAQITGGQLVTFGQTSVAGGIARALPVTFPLTFSFDFRSDASGDGGWEIGFNEQSPIAPLCCPHAYPEFVLFQYSGQQALGFGYQTATGPFFDYVPIDAAQQPYQSGATSHVSGVVNADLSAQVTITYPDGSHVTLSTPAPPPASVSPQGLYFTIGNSNASFGPHYFDNIQVRPAFVDDFSRSDGAVGNGWVTWGAGAQIAGGQLVTFGQTSVAGGIARALPVTFPLTFSFDFRTDSPGDGGWEIGFNAQSPTVAVCCPSGYGYPELALHQYSGLQAVGYAYQTAAGPFVDFLPLDPGQEQYQSGASSHISGVVNADLSSQVTITYPDGSHVTLSTPAPPPASVSPQGLYFSIGNSNASFGPHYFDNIVVSAEAFPVVNTNVGSGVVVDVPTTLPDSSPGSVSVTFDQVTTAGQTTVTTSSSGPLPPTGFTLTTPPVYYEITTTATFTGNVRVCLSWNEGQVANEDEVRLFHWESTAWADITDATSRNTVTNRLCGTTTSLSPFALFDVSPAGSLSSLAPALLWIGLKNGDAVGLRIDLRTEVLLGGNVVASGEVYDLTTGSGGFNNAVLRTVAPALTGGPVDVPSGTQLGLRVSVRRTCFGGGHNSGTVRLWFNGQPIDAGNSRDAGSRFGATIGSTSATRYLRAGSALSESAGSAKQSVDAAVNSTAACPARPFVAFGTWSVTMP